MIIKPIGDIEIFGIRHHGPGSARSLVEALRSRPPDLILIEGPPDAAGLIPLAAHADMRPPVAMLVYNPKNLAQASFFPFAEFSPEWQAILFGLEHHIPLRFMDLPMSLAFGLREPQAQQSLDFETSSNSVETSDPFHNIALLAGYTDPERWWDAMMERGTAEGIFHVILELMQALREAKNQPETRETMLREAFMRQTIRTAQQEGFSKIAVVCGAWHGPALANLEKTKARADADLFKGLKKIKTEATWIPWSFDRLAAQSGYSAGVVAPAWYRILWNTASASANSAAGTPHAVFLTQVARLLREQDIAVSSAHVIEAVRLAGNLAALRNTALPGIEELREAAITALCSGAEKQLELIDQQLVIGEVLGAVPANLPLPPLKEDFEKQVKNCRLEKNTREKPLELDLREEAQLRKSRLFHRLDWLGIPWGKEQAVGSGKQGGFHEHWQLHWLPDFEIRLIEAGAWGNTVEDAASRRAWRRVRDSENLAELTALLSTALKADLPAVLPVLLQKMQHISALARDTLLLADAVLPLAEVSRYGSARRLNLGAVERLLGQIIPRVCVQLPAACTGVDDEGAADILKKILAVNRATGILQVAEYEAQWVKMLKLVAEMSGVAPLLAGLSARLLFDKNIRPAGPTGDAMRFRLSRAQVPAETARWLEGFLYGSALLLLHHAELRQILDGWVSELPDDYFIELLPLLRRTFSRFSAPERQKILDLAKHTRPDAPSRPAEEGWDMERGKGVLALLREILEA